jgi:hypothetical protein
MSATYTATSGHTFKHVCPSGPLCEGWDTIDDDMAPHPEGCDHDSCLAYLYEGCEACFVESMDEYTAAEDALYGDPSLPIPFYA